MYLVGLYNLRCRTPHVGATVTGRVPDRTLVHLLRAAQCFQRWFEQVDVRLTPKVSPTVLLYVNRLLCYYIYLQDSDNPEYDTDNLCNRKIQNVKVWYEQYANGRDS